VTQNDPVLRDVLSAIKTLLQARSSSHRIACVFDMDSTLFCVSTRTQAILRELALEESFRSQFEEVSEHLKDVKVLPSDWGLKHALKRLNLEFPEKAMNAIRAFWREHFFSSAYLVHDILYEGSAEFIRMCEELQCEIFYLTGRSDRLMRRGSLDQLKRYDFPLKRPEHLIMKTEDEQNDEDFKLNRMRALAEDFEEVYFFENEPVIVDSIRKELPQVKIIFMDSTHSSRMPTPLDLPRITPDSFLGFKKRP
jgi:hypothetical protein